MSRKRSSHSRRAKSSGSNSSGRGSKHTSRVTALICLLAALPAFALTALDAYLPPTIPTIAAALAFIAIVAGACAQVLQRRRASRRANRMLRIGLPLALLTLLLITINHLQSDSKNRAPSDGSDSVTPTNYSLDTPPDEHPLFAPSWYGTAEFNGFLVIANSFASTSHEAKEFGAMVSQPVQHARITIINRSGIDPLLPNLLGVRALHPDSTETECLNIYNLLRANAAANTMRTRLQKLTPLIIGAMAPDLPLAFPPDLDWHNVTALRIKLGTTTLLVPGHVLTSEEKRRLLDSSPPPPPQSNLPAPSGAPAEKWFKDL